MLFLRAAPLLLALLAVIYLCTFFYLRDRYRDRLENGADRMEPAFIDARVQTYAARMRRRLGWIVFGVPLSMVALAILIVDLM